MARTYTEIKRIIQPLYQRYRSIFRGPRNSGLENLEMNKILIDLKRLDAQADALREKIHSDVRIFIGQDDTEFAEIHTEYSDGKYYRFDDIIVEFYGDSATPDYVQVDTISTISSRMSRLIGKIQALENKKV